jgi:hypothetical protein
MNTKTVFGVSLAVAFILGALYATHPPRPSVVQEVQAADERTEQEKRGLHAVEVQVDGYWCIVGYFGVDVKPVSINCK